ncbi:hypothetical protein SH501x_002726 [Pirellulaceae bacterium SH501]
MTTLPTEVDFDPWGGDLDAQWAWKNFGGLTLDAAKEKFSQKPECYHEDFMSMGSRAFSFYFPVIETHILDASIDYEGWDRCAWILAHAIKSQFQRETRSVVLHLVPRIRNLIQFVRQNIARFDDDAAEQSRILLAWAELDEVVRQFE